MTTITRSSQGLLRSLPLFVPLFLLLVAALLIPVSPGGDGIYRVTAADFTVVKPDCVKDGETTKCVIPVGDRVLTVSMKTDLQHLNSPCTATFDGKPASCTRDHGVGRPTTPAARVSGFSVTEQEAAQVRDAQPWWNGIGERSITVFLFWVLVALCAAVAVASWVLSGTARAANPRRALMTSYTLAAAALLPVASNFMLAPVDRALTMMGALLMPHLSLAPILVMVLWQMLVGRELTGKVGQRLSLALTALVVTAVYGFSMLLWSAFATGLVD
ncbi:hypothetical protein AB0I60_04015 [Actinosynnema sp. NPDC050436]|uniref:hypothetical protein n=1 Tax=Actinosynnema sp. NPDC050436 TaxID=3155659 RepID=UPI0033DD04D4